MKKRLVGILLILALLSGCVRQTPALVGTPTPEFTPTPPPTPTPELVMLPDETDLDATGKRIDSDAHFMDYLTFQMMRVYEYDSETFLDGLCNNTYPEPLTGAFEIIFLDTNGAELARAPIVLQNENGLLLPGENKLYTQIDTDMDIQLSQFQMVVMQRVWPAVSMTINE